MTYFASASVQLYSFKKLKVQWYITICLGIKHFISVSLEIMYPFVVVQSLKLCLTLCDPMNYSTLDFLVLHYLPELA